MGVFDILLMAIRLVSHYIYFIYFITFLTLQTLWVFSVFFCNTRSECGSKNTPVRYLNMYLDEAFGLLTSPESYTRIIR